MKEKKVFNDPWCVKKGLMALQRRPQRRTGFEYALQKCRDLLYELEIIKITIFFSQYLFTSIYRFIFRCNSQYVLYCSVSIKHTSILYFELDLTLQWAHLLHTWGCTIVFSISTLLNRCSLHGTPPSFPSLKSDEISVNDVAILKPFFSVRGLSDLSLSSGIGLLYEAIGILYLC